MPRLKSGQPINTALQKGRKSTQRDRLLAGMVAAANRGGLAGANVSEVIAHAGVSRPTFYDYFADRDDCFLATVTDVQRQLVEQVHGAVRARAPEDAASAAVEALLRFAVSEPARARLLMKEALAGGRAVLDARDRGIAEIAQIVERSFAQAPAWEAIPDLPIAMVIGAIYRLLASRLRRGERALGGMLEELLGWIGSYEQPAGEQQPWHTLAPGPALAPSPFVSATPFQAAPRFAPHQPRPSEETLAENHRQRIMLATCQVVHEQGYTAATVAEITRLAGVDGRSFYRVFASKQEAFSAIYELGFQHLMSTCARAFFAGDSWPDRIWETMRAAAQFVQGDPALANIGFVTAYAVGPGEIQRVEDSRVSFTIFLQEGYRHDSQRNPPSELALEAIMATIFEIVYHQARQSANPEIAGLLAHIVHLCLTPFMGPEQANRFIDKKLGESRQASGGKGGAKAKRAAPRKRARGSAQAA